jgi:hypothetical protein
MQRRGLPYLRIEAGELAPEKSVTAGPVADACIARSPVSASLDVPPAHIARCAIPRIARSDSFRLEVFFVCLFWAPARVSPAGAMLQRHFYLLI